jgi:biopolymer transport protein ExbD
MQNGTSVPRQKVIALASMLPFHVLVLWPVQSRLYAAATPLPQPELHVRGDKAVRYERVAKAMAAAHRAGMHNIGFVIDQN